MATTKHTRARKAPRRPSRRSTNPTIAESIANLLGPLTTARSAVSITAQAFDHGETDLEIQSAQMLTPAAETLDEILNELLSLRWEAEEIPENARKEVVHG